MELKRKLAILADAAKYDASCASSGVKGRKAAKGGMGSAEGTGICHAYTPDGRCVSLLKILLTNWCIFDCAYCVNRRSSDVERARFSVDEVVRLTLEFYRRNYIEGLFLSSGIIRDSDYTMERLIEVARRLRLDHGFAGYVHLKTIPEASPELVIEAGKWADRLSINVELPRQKDLDRLAPDKQLVQIRGAMERIRGRIDESRERSRVGVGRAAPKFAPAGQSTQMIVGATDASDRDVLSTSTELYSTQRLRRVYYSAYSPIPHASGALPAQAPPLLREHRLYQADWLLRFYGFTVDELFDGGDGTLPLRIDPKTAWALAHREFFPVDVNGADREALLRVPGLGVRNVERVIAARRHRSLRRADLERLNVARRALLFLTTADDVSARRRVDSVGLADLVPTAHQQIDLFAAASARTGEV